jgi:hypothetical protein
MENSLVNECNELLSVDIEAGSTSVSKTLFLNNLREKLELIENRLKQELNKQEVESTEVYRILLIQSKSSYFAS